MPLAIVSSHNFNFEINQAGVRCMRIIDGRAGRERKGRSLGERCLQ